MSQQELFPESKLSGQVPLDEKIDDSYHSSPRSTRSGTEGTPKDEPLWNYQEPLIQYDHQANQPFTSEGDAYQTGYHSRNRRHNETLPAQVVSNKKYSVKLGLLIVAVLVLIVIVLVLFHPLLYFGIGLLSIVASLAFALALPFLLFGIIKVLIIVSSKRGNR